MVRSADGNKRNNCFPQEEADSPESRDDCRADFTDSEDGKSWGDLSNRLHQSCDFLVLEDQIQRGILAIPFGLPKIHEKALYVEEFSVFSHRSHKLAKRKHVSYASLEADDIWLWEEGHCLRDQVLDVCALKKNKDTPRKFQFESGSLGTLKRLVTSYGGYTLLPALAVENLGPEVISILFERPIPARERGMVYKPGP